MYPMNETTTELLERIRAKLEAKKAPWDKQNPKKYGSSVSKKEKKCKTKKSKHPGKSVLEGGNTIEISGAFPLCDNTLDVLEKVRLEMMSYDAVNSEASAGESGADNITDVDEAFDMYLDSILERMLTALSASEEQAVEFIMLVADEMEEEGMMPPMPGSDASDDEVSVWMGSAKTCGFANKVLEMAKAI
jgi:hypothetical protein